MNISLRQMLIASLLAVPILEGTVAAQQRQPLNAGAIEVFYGVIPAEMILGHPEGYPERTMHEGVPRGSGQHHLIITLFDSRTRERVTDAAVRARVTEAGLSPQGKPLEPMTIAGALSYGNYFRMSGPGPYRIEVEMRRPGAANPVNASFEYSHPRR